MYRSNRVDLTRELRARVPEIESPVWRVSVHSMKGKVSKDGDKYRFRIRVEGDNASTLPLGWSGVTINVPTVNSRGQYSATEIQMSSVGCNTPSKYGPGDEIWGFREDGTFGKKVASCLLMECVREKWTPGERIAFEAVVVASCKRLDAHIRVWSTRPDTRGGFGDPDWNAATLKDQQGISVYPMSLEFRLWDALKHWLRRPVARLQGAHTSPVREPKLGAKQVPTGGSLVPPAQSRRPSERTGPVSVALRSPTHPAHALAVEADCLADGEDRSIPKLVAVIDRALVLAPHDADLLYAKACAVSDSLGFLSEKAAPVLKQLRNEHPEHIDLVLKEKKYFARPLLEQWEGVFYFNGWSTEDRRLKGLMFSRLMQERHVQIVRHCLAPSIAIVWGADREFCDRINRMRWELRWMQTPYGNLAVHYLVMDWGKNESRRNEAFLPHGLSNPSSPMDGYCLLQRMAYVHHCFLVLADEDENVLRNELFVFPESVKRSLQNVKKELDARGPVPQHASWPRQAQQWYMDHTDVKSIKF